MPTEQPANRSADRRTRKLSVVVPAYNEEAVIETFHDRLSKVLRDLGMASEVIYVNDGSTDGTREIIERLCRQDPAAGLVDLSRNFGKEIALTAGLDHTTGDAVVVTDADLQDPPELIPELVAVWEQGYDVVYAQRQLRLGETWLKTVTAAAFYRVIGRLTRVQIPRNTGDFRLLSRRAVNALCKLRENHRFMKGLFAWIGFKQKAVLYQREARFAGKTKWNYWKLWNLALEGITSFTVVPLTFSTYLGVLTAVGAFLYGLFIIARTLLFGRDLPGYPSLMVVILFMGGIQLMVLGLIGEYLGRTFNEVKGRPLYLLDRFLQPSGSASRGADAP